MASAIYTVGLYKKQAIVRWEAIFMTCSLSDSEQSLKRLYFLLLIHQVIFNYCYQLRYISIKFAHFIYVTFIPEFHSFVEF